MGLTVEENIPGLMIFIDFQKAFDSLECNYLLKCLQYFNFRPDLNSMGINKNIQSCEIGRASCRERV